ncbi:hypothetical protein DL89DRAFT_291891 [Linderina pennispora]|uniref:TPX2 C-terminal domain-containing protein n=1 Tax=Linderina pennispora TaxID=61395 RepID=A0A1Y1WCU7_9FUNG|nr:uncharacterized protein DL89DRAFT_291891 [Linderina pennispora]ORX71377.1 hypothetical protein DL89DRAFT_291891 [Linderina pennispora]
MDNKTQRPTARRSPGSGQHTSKTTPKKSPVRGKYNGKAADVWEFDAPRFYDFQNTRTPGRADKWFDISHPTPAIKPTKASRSYSNDIFSPDSVDSFTPNRPSLTPSRVIETDGKLLYDESKDSPGPVGGVVIEDVQFSDSDEEQEYEKWKQRQPLAQNMSESDNEGTVELASMYDQEPEKQSSITVGPSAKPRALKARRLVPKPAPKKGYKPLTVPVERGFMRPTKGAQSRLLQKQHENLAQQAALEAIARAKRRSRVEQPGTLTVPKPFQFHENALKEGEGEKQAESSRGTKRKQTEETELEDRPRPKALRPTVPKTPQFATSLRVRRAAAEPIKTALKPSTAKSAASAILARLSPLRPTIAKPFTFRSDAVVEKHLQRLRAEMAKLRAEEEARRQFQAQPLPEFPTPQKPARRTVVPLQASPFNLQTEVRGAAYQRQLRARLEDLEERQRKRREFKAQPIPESLDRPFVPATVPAKVTQPEEVVLQTEERSEERRVFDEDRMRRERIREEVLARKRLEDEKREEAEMRQLRKLLVHKPEPIRQYRPTVIQPSDRPLTVPKTPKWHVRRRRTSTADSATDVESDVAPESPPQ